MDIHLPATSNSIYGYGFEVFLSLDASHLAYGYGYGDFDGSYPTYFDVFSISGNEVGYGIEDHLSGYDYGWGYEETISVSGGNDDPILVTATVTDNGAVPDEPSNIPVLFTGSPGIYFNKNIVYTDSNGQASVYVTVDSSVLRNMDSFGADSDDGERPRYLEYPSLGYMKIEATIPKSMVIRDWEVHLEVGITQSFGEETFEYLFIPTFSNFYY
jgi:hypothetical protein